MSKFEIFNPQEVQWKDFGGELKTAVFQGSDALTIQYFELPAKSKGNIRTQELEQILYVVHGHMGMHVDGQDYCAHQGSLMRIPPNVPYYGFNPCNHTAITMKILVPKRDIAQSEKVDDFTLNA